MDYQTGLCFVNFLIVVFGIPDSTHFYSVDLEAHSFEEAQKLCSSDGSLANMPNQEETLKILKVIEDKRERNSTLFWIGLKKEKTHCVQEDLPLRGFHWTIDNSINFVLNKWKEEPSGTCTNALCGLLSVEYEDSSLFIVSWGLASKPCSKKLPFICRHKGLSNNNVCAFPPVISGAHDITQKNNDPYTLWVSCTGSDKLTLTCSKTTGEWKLVGGTGEDIQGLCLKCENGYEKDKNGKCVDVDECKQTNICKFMCLNTAGSYSCMCADDRHNFHPEDSEICKKMLTPPFMSTTDATNNVQDKPTSSSMDKKLPSSSQPAESTTESGVHIEESTRDMANVVIPLIIALLILVVLVVIIVAIVKYCLMRRSRKQAKKMAVSLKETVALKVSDSMEKVNE